MKKKYHFERVPKKIIFVDMRKGLPISVLYDEKPKSNFFHGRLIYEFPRRDASIRRAEK